MSKDKMARNSEKSKSSESTFTKKTTLKELQFLDRLYRDNALTPSARLIAYWIVRWTNNDRTNKNFGYSFAGRDKLSELTGFSPETISSACKELRIRGWIVVKRRPNDTSLIRPNWDNVCPEADTQMAKSRRSKADSLDDLELDAPARDVGKTTYPEGGETTYPEGGETTYPDMEKSRSYSTDNNRADFDRPDFDRTDQGKKEIPESFASGSVCASSNDNTAFGGDRLNTKDSGIKRKDYRQPKPEADQAWSSLESLWSDMVYEPGYEPSTRSISQAKSQWHILLGEHGIHARRIVECAKIMIEDMNDRGLTVPSLMGFLQKYAKDCTKPDCRYYVEWSELKSQPETPCSSGQYEPVGTKAAA